LESPKNVGNRFEKSWKNLPEYVVPK